MLDNQKLQLWQFMDKANIIFLHVGVLFQAVSQTLQLTLYLKRVCYRCPRSIVPAGCELPSLLEPEDKYCL